MRQTTNHTWGNVELPLTPTGVTPGQEAILRSKHCAAVPPASKASINFATETIEKRRRLKQALRLWQTLWWVKVFIFLIDIIITFVSHVSLILQLLIIISVASCFLISFPPPSISESAWLLFVSNNQARKCKRIMLVVDSKPANTSMHIFTWLIAMTFLLVYFFWGWHYIKAWKLAFLYLNVNNPVWRQFLLLIFMHLTEFSLHERDHMICVHKQQWNQ